MQMIKRFLQIHLPIPNFYCLEQSAGSIGLQMNANKTEFMEFTQERATFNLSDRTLKLADQLPYLGSNISSSESDFNIRLAKAKTAIDRSLII